MPDGGGHPAQLRRVPPTIRPSPLGFGGGCPLVGWEPPCLCGYLVLLVLLPQEGTEGYAKPSLKKCRPIAARNEDKKVFSGRL